MSNQKIIPEYVNNFGLKDNIINTTKNSVDITEINRVILMSDFDEKYRILTEEWIKDYETKRNGKNTIKLDSVFKSINNGICILAILLSLVLFMMSSNIRIIVTFITVISLCILFIVCIANTLFLDNR